jgi:cytochrome P450
MTNATVSYDPLAPDVLAALARLEARIAFDELFARAPRMEPADVGRTPSLVFRGPTSLPVRLAG